MHTQPSSDARYYIFGAGPSEAQLRYVGLAEQPPEAQCRAIFDELAGCASEPVRHWANSLLGGGLAHAFELESYHTLPEAEEAVHWWRRYLRSLGLPLLDAGT